MIVIHLETSALHTGAHWAGQTTGSHVPSIVVINAGKQLIIASI